MDRVDAEEFIETSAMPWSGKSPCSHWKIATFDVLDQDTMIRVVRATNPENNEQSLTPDYSMAELRSSAVRRLWQVRACVDLERFEVDVSPENGGRRWPSH